MPDAAKIAAQLPLVTVVSDKAFAKGQTHHLLSDEKAELAGRETIPVKVEKLCELQPSQYFFASLAEPDFGVVGLAYSPEVESGLSGSANPYDTGGTLAQRCDPFGEISDEEIESRISELQGQTNSVISSWRLDLQKYLEDYYDTPNDYVLGKRPDVIPKDAHRDLPARFEENKADRRAYTWEVRVYQKLPIGENLEKLATDAGTFRAMQRATSQTNIPIRSHRRTSTSLWELLEKVKRFVEDIDTDAIHNMQKTIEEEVLS